VVELLTCPHCGSRLEQSGSTLRCSQGHAFDIARQGYVNLLPGTARAPSGDTASMVRARAAFLEGGHFAGLRDAIVETAARAVGEASTTGGASAGCVIEVGAGTGYYLSAVLDRLVDRVGLAVDISKFALRRAGRAHERLGAVACNTWQRLPVRDQCADLILDIFAPRNPSEFRRLLGTRGRLIVVTPSDRHLRELISALGLLEVDERKQDRVEAQLAEDFIQTSSVHRDEFLMLTPAEVSAVAEMGPSAFHIPSEEIGERAALLTSSVSVTVSVNIGVYRAAQPTDSASTPSCQDS
jgi:23S rRNA (guanine745-N1)-methyltransferase